MRDQRYTPVLSAFVRAASVAVATFVASASHAQPSITFIDPNAGVPTSGGVELNVLGSNFEGIDLVRLNIGGRPAPVLGFDDNVILALAPEGQGVDLDVEVIVDGESAVLPDAFSYAPPVIASVSPPSGSVDGGNEVTIVGSNFGITPRVTFGGEPAVVTSISHTSLDVIAPSSSSTGAAPVVVEVGDQISAAANYTYEAPQLAVAAITPSAAPTEGGALLEISGDGFFGLPLVEIGGEPAPVSSVSDGTLVVETPEGEGTNLDVSVQSGGQVAVIPGGFGYLPPAVSGFGPVFNGQVEVFGSNFGLGPQVLVGGIPATVEEVDHDRLLVTLPSASPGSMVDVVVAVGGQTSAPAPFIYPDAAADLNGDGVVDATDLGILIASWGMVP